MHDSTSTNVTRKECAQLAYTTLYQSRHANFCMCNRQMATLLVAKLLTITT